MNESAEDYVNYEGQSAYDVADMLKQYFRDLPEPLMTNKLSETFLQIYQCEYSCIFLRLLKLCSLGPTETCHSSAKKKKISGSMSYQFVCVTGLCILNK